jgi:hypothetical protein
VADTPELAAEAVVAGIVRLRGTPTDAVTQEAHA